MNIGTSTRPAQIVGSSVASNFIEKHLSKKNLLVIDANVTKRVTPFIANKYISQIVLVKQPVKLEHAQNLAQLAQTYKTERLTAVGGGNVIDLVKLAASEITNPRILSSLMHQANTKGFLIRSSPKAQPLPFDVIPTTIGTGSEVNATACFESNIKGVPMKSIVDLRQAIAATVIYDPTFTAAPNILLRQGLFEIAARIVGAAIGTPSSLRLAETEAEFLFARIVSLVNKEGELLQNNDDRVEAALISAASHSGWALRGRGFAPSPLWLLSAEFSVAASITKNESTMRLIIPWLTRIAQNDRRWGSPEALAKWSKHIGNLNLISWFNQIIKVENLHHKPLKIDCEFAARQVKARFGFGSLADVDTLAIAELFAEAELGAIS